ncbi:hypothetical protein RFI_06598 [Reticulomyxa filosa]|uniref:Uncharacterized protein n=1 Tax=Reticulomyxa filosa TaxID=46433 RepID=X6NXA7_RETFI|nr:hypothetical protein RFI_06598 [Reticulomyxa filosa]|eukprot:ETO30523.1 hypothetical protein RFI_06598 [Reticulomyxa filosa]
MVSCLQEMGFNVDTHTQTQENSMPSVSSFEMNNRQIDSKGLELFYKHRIATIYNHGSKSVSGYLPLGETTDDSQKRLELFAEWIFSTTHIHGVLDTYKHKMQKRQRSFQKINGYNNGNNNNNNNNNNHHQHVLTSNGSEKTVFVQTNNIVLPWNDQQPDIKKSNSSSSSVSQIKQEEMMESQTTIQKSETNVINGEDKPKKDNNSSGIDIKTDTETEMEVKSLVDFDYEIEHEFAVPAFIAVGHSSWFKMFFQKYLETDDEQHAAIHKKMENCAIVAFRMGFDVQHERYFIPESTLTVLYKEIKLQSMILSCFQIYFSSCSKLVMCFFVKFVNYIVIKSKLKTNKYMLILFVFLSFRRCNFGY